MVFIVRAGALMPVYREVISLPRGIAESGGDSCMTSAELLKVLSDPTSSFPEIEEEQAMKAYLGALSPIEDKYDALYFFACMNLLNAYVKKENAGEFRKRYRFKDYVIHGIEQVIIKKIDGVEIYLQPDVTYVSLFGLQFSFHNLRPTSFLRKQYMNSPQNKKQEWTNIRLQPPARIIFEWAEEMRRNKWNNGGKP